MKRADRYRYITEWFQANMPSAQSELHYKNPYELLVAVILSAQCTDKRVNMTTPALFERYPTVKAMSESTTEEIYTYIKSISYPNNKAKNLLGMSRMVMSEFNGEIPSDIDALQRLPGVGRKTANVMGVVLYNKSVMPVDTHVFRVAARLGLTVGAKTPLQSEMQLEKYFPADILPVAHHWLILHGRYVCLARKPKCGECGLKPWCKYYETEQKGRENIGV